MHHDFQESLDADSDFIPLRQSQLMDQSLVAVSEKVLLHNASQINRAELERDMRFQKEKDEGFEETQNQFLEVGKWRKNKETVQSKEMASVKQQVQEIMIKTRWKTQGEVETKKEEKEEEVIADQSICPEEEPAQEEAIEDQTQEAQQKDEEQQDEQGDEQEQEQEEQQQEQSDQEEQQQEEEQQQQQGQEQEKQQVKIEEDDKTDTQSQMKRTEYAPSKWTKKRESQVPSNSSISSSWQRKQAILQRILLLTKQ